MPCPSRLTLEPLEDREVPAFGLDPAFGIGGAALGSFGPVRFSYVTASAAAPSDKSVVVGPLVGSLPYGTGGNLGVARLTATGAADTSFGGGDGVADFAFDMHHHPSAVAVLADGKILVAGTTAFLQGGAEDGFVIRLNPNGMLDTTFGTGGEARLNFNGADTLSRMVVQSDGKILVAGSSTAPWNGDVSAYPQSRLALERLNANGTLDTTFGFGGLVLGPAEVNGWVTGGLAIQPDGKILVGGSILPAYTPLEPVAPPELAVQRFNASGGLDTTFGPSNGRAVTSYGSFGFASLNDMALLSDGRIVLGGSNLSFGLLAWFGANGTLQSQEQFQPASSGGSGIGYIDRVIALPRGGVEVFGPWSNGTAMEYHAAPGVASERLVVAANSAAASLSASGKLLLPAVIGGPNPADPCTFGGALGAVRLTDPGTNSSPVTFLRWASQTDVLGGPVTLYAEVVPLLGSEAVFGGTITFREGNTVLGTLAPGGPVNPWELIPVVSVALAPGEHVITAEYSGTSRWSGSRITTTVRVREAVSVGATLSVSDDNPALGETITLTATLTRTDNSSPLANALVSFIDGDVVIGTAVTLLNGVATLTTSALPSGAREVRAVYLGGDNFLPAESASVRVDVSRAYTEVRLAASVAAPVVGQLFTILAHVYPTTNAGVVPTGSVTFYDGSTVLGTSSMSSTGVAAFTTSLRLGAHTLRAVYSGDAAMFGSDAAPISVTVGRAATATALTSSAATVAPGKPITLTATVQAPGTAFPVGTVEFREGTRVLGTATIDGRGQAKLTLTNLTPGAHAITAVYAGCSTCLGSTSGASSVTVTGAIAPVSTTTTLTTSVPNPVFGQDQVLTARVTGGAPAGGKVEFYDGTTLLGSATLNDRGEAGFTARLNLSAHKLRAVYLGVPTAASSSSVVLNQTVTKAPTTVALTMLDGKIRAQVTAPFAGAPIGTVIFKDGDVVIGTASVNGAGVATFNFVARPGQYRLTAVYSGSSCFLGATSLHLDMTVGA